MNVSLGRHTDDIFSLTIMLLMTVAFVASQAEATVHDTVRSDTGFAATTANIVAAGVDTLLESTVVRADIAMDLCLHQLREIGSDHETTDAVRKLIEIRLRTRD